MRLLLASALVFVLASIVAAQACGDGTPFGNCSAAKPFFCDYGALVPNCAACGCNASQTCDGDSGECVAPSAAVAISSPLGGEVVAPSEVVRITGATSGMPQGAYLTIDDSRFRLNWFNPADGTFEFVNTSALQNGTTAVRVSMLDAQGSNIGMAAVSFSISSGGGDGGVGLLLWVPALIGGILILFAIVSLAYGRKAIFEPKLKPHFQLMNGDTVLVEGPVDSRKEGFCLELLKDAARKGKTCAIVSYAPEMEASLFSKAEKPRLLLVKVEPEIAGMATAISGMVENAPSIAYFDILHALAPKYGVRELLPFLEATIMKLKEKSVTSLVVLEKDVLPSQALAEMEGIFDGVAEFEVRPLAGRQRLFFRIKGFKLRKSAPDWIELG